MLNVLAIVYCSAKSSCLRCLLMGALRGASLAVPPKWVRVLFIYLQVPGAAVLLEVLTR